MHKTFKYYYIIKCDSFLSLDFCKAYVAEYMLYYITVCYNERLIHHKLYLIINILQTNKTILFIRSENYYSGFIYEKNIGYKYFFFSKLLIRMDNLFYKSLDHTYSNFI